MIRPIAGVLFIVASMALVASAKREYGAWASHFLKRDNSHLLGAEYDAIAQSIREGRGFSDPFKEPSGATAWMPPLLPYFIAGLYALFGDNRESVFLAFVALQLIAPLIAGFVVFGAARVHGRYLIVPLVLALAMAADFYELFQRTHDTQLLVICVSALLAGVIKLWERPESYFVAAGWGLIGGVFALLSPVMGFVWAAITVLRWSPSFGELSSHSIMPLAIASVVSMAVVSPWVIRNYFQFDRFIPIKSNLAYEVWQSQCLDDDGVLDSQTGSEHLWQPRSQQRREYLKDGELKFIERRWTLVFESVADAPLEILSRVANRWFAATIYYHTFNPSDEQYVWPMRYKRAYFALPFICLLLILLFQRTPFPRELQATIMIYVLFLTPYIVVSYYDRYAAPLFGIKALLVLYFTDFVWEVIRTGAARYGGSASARSLPSLEK